MIKKSSTLNVALSPQIMPKNNRKITPGQCRAARGLLHISQMELAEISGLSKQALSLFEIGKTVPVPTSMRAIIAALEDRGIKFLDKSDGVPGLGVCLIAGAEGVAAGRSTASAVSAVIIDPEVE